MTETRRERQESPLLAGFFVGEEWKVVGGEN